MPRKEYYSAHKKDLIEKQRIRRQKEKENVQKALAELERLEKLEQSRLDVQNLESETVKKILRAQLREDRESEEIEGARPWQ